MTTTHRSAFGGLWTDRHDARTAMEERRNEKGLSSSLAEQIVHWIEHGYVSLPGAVAPELCDEFATEIEHAWADGHPEQLVVDSTNGQRRKLSAGDATRLTRAVDSHVHFASARAILASQPVTSFLRAVFDADPLVFQTLLFEVGSEQGLHQDTAFVVVDRPLEMVGVWIALEDVLPGSGELRYVPGSHRLPDYCFGEGRRYYDPSQDSRQTHDDYYPLVEKRCADTGLDVEHFFPKKGDVLIWSADLVHGGSPITNPNSTRRSLVAHACPADAQPHFYSYLPMHRVSKALPNGAGRYASSYHELAPDHP